jgi:ligand-binding sensor domain-containing protein
MEDCMGWGGGTEDGLVGYTAETNVALQRENTRQKRHKIATFTRDKNIHAQTAALY